jgi:peptidyl-prolyl cis-trans isomerase D
MVSGRVVSYTKAHQLPLAEVKARVRDKVVQAQAAALARKLGEERLAVLTKAPATVLTEAPLVVSRAKAGELPRAVVEAVLKAASTTLPAYVGVDLAEQGYAVAKLTKVLGRDPVAADAARAQSSYAQTWGDAESQAYYDALKSRFKVDTARAAAVAAAAAADSAASAAKAGVR